MKNLFIKGDKVKFNIRGEEFKGIFDSYHGNQCVILVNNGESDEFKIIDYKFVQLVEISGYKPYRCKTNPKEKEFHDKFIKDHVEQDRKCNTSFLIFSAKDNFLSQPMDNLSDREIRIVISTIQWLGSPVGKNFLRSCGFEESNKNIGHTDYKENEMGKKMHS